MSKRKHWFPCSHDINNDHEMWAMRDLLGDRSLGIWLEILSIGDRNNGLVGPMSDANWSAIGHRSHSTLTKVGLVFGWALERGWLVCDPLPRLAKYADYHRTRGLISTNLGANERPSYPNLPNLPNSLKKENQEPARPAPSADSKKPEIEPTINQARGGQEKSRLFDAGIKAVSDRIYQSDPEKFKRLVVWIRQAQAENFSTAVIIEALERFAPYASTVGNWYPYLDKLIYKTDQDLNRDRHDAKHVEHKEELRALSHLVALRGGKDAER